MKTFLIKLPQNMHTDLKVLAFKRGLTMQDFILNAIRQEMGRVKE